MVRRWAAVKPFWLFRLVPMLLSVSLGLSCSSGKDHRAAAPGSPTPSGSVSSPTTAEATVAAFYAFIGRHDAADAVALLDPGYAHGQADPSGVGNTVRLTNVRDLRAAPEPSPQGLPAGYTDITQVFVTYDVVYKQEIAAMNGPNSRFLYLGRNSAGEWRILEIGTGP